jgi:hypothetical protein
MVFTAFKSAQVNGTSKQKTKGGKNKLMNVQNNTTEKTIRKTDLNTQMYKCVLQAIV